MQTPFLEALRPLDGQIKSLVMLQKIHPAKSHPVNIMTGALNCSQGEVMSSRCLSRKLCPALRTLIQVIARPDQNRQSKGYDPFNESHLALLHSTRRIALRVIQEAFSESLCNAH